MRQGQLCKTGLREVPRNRYSMVIDGLGRYRHIQQRIQRVSLTSNFVLDALRWDGSDIAAPLIIVLGLVVDALQTPRNKHLFAQEIQVQELLQDWRNELMWVPDHCGIKGKEEADRLTSLGRDGALLIPKIPGDDVKLWLRYTIREAWDFLRSRQTLNIRKIKPTPQHRPHLSSWRDQVFLSRLWPGHTKLRLIPAYGWKTQ